MIYPLFVRLAEPFGGLISQRNFWLLLAALQQGFDVVGGVLQVALVQHPGSPSQIRAGQAAVQRYNNVPGLYPIDQRKAHTVHSLVEHQSCSGSPFDTVGGVTEKKYQYA